MLERHQETDEMPDIYADYKIPAELHSFIDSGFMELLSEDSVEKTLEFVIPSMAYTDERGQENVFTLTWIHPDFNAQFCHYYHEQPGDLANFYLHKRTSESGDEQFDMQTLDDLICWLQDRERAL